MVAFRHQVLNDSSLYDMDLRIDEFDENTARNDDFAPRISMSFNASFPAPYLRAYANNDSLECDVTYTNDVTTGRSSAACDVTVEIETNLLALIRAEAYLPPNEVLVTTELMVQFGKRYLYSPRLTTDEASVAWSSYSC